SKIYEFYTMLENEEELISLLMNYQDGINVTIGNENQLDAIKHFRLITSPYKLGTNQIGTIALIGPTRMEYRKVITLLQSISNELTDLMLDVYGLIDHKIMLKFNVGLKKMEELFYGRRERYRSL